MGYERYDAPEAIIWLNQVYGLLDPYANLVLPSLKVIEKTREGSKLKRRYDSAKTPLERLIEKGALEKGAQRALEVRQKRLNPLALRRKLRALLSKGPTPVTLPEAAD